MDRGREADKQFELVGRLRAEIKAELPGGAGHEREASDPTRHDEPKEFDGREVVKTKIERTAEAAETEDRIGNPYYSPDDETPRSPGAREPSPFTTGHRLVPEGAVESWQQSDGYRLGTVRRFSRDGGMTVRRVTGLKVLR